MALAALFFVSNLQIARAETAEWLPWRKLVPGFSLSAIGGEAPRLDALGGRIVIVHFFATWCAPCRAELPALQRFAARTDSERLTILVIAVGEPEMRVRRFRDELALTLPILIDGDRAVTKAWQVALLPTSVVLGPDLSARLGIEADIAWDDIDPEALIRAALALRPEADGMPGRPPPQSQREQTVSEGG